MTIPSTARKAGPLLGTGAQTAWPFTFKVFAAADVAVTIADSLGVETALVLDTDYSVTLNANQETSPGGTITYPISGSPLAVGSKLSIIGDLDYDQPLDLPSGGNFSPLALENELDRLTMQIQQLKEQVGRALLVPVTSTADVQLPNPEPNELIGWDSTGDNLANYALAELATGIAYGTMRFDTFTGNGSTTQFALTEDPAALANLGVSIAGVTQVPGTDYTLTSATLVFTTAPVNGVAILARYGRALPISGPVDSSAVTHVATGAGAVATTVQSKLRESVSVFDFMTAAQIADVQAGTALVDVTARLEVAIAVATIAKANLVFPPGTYKIVTPSNADGFQVDLGVMSIAASGNVKIDCTALTTNYAMQVFSSLSYPESHYQNTTHGMSGLSFVGGADAGVNGLLVYHPTYTSNCQFKIESCSFYNFDINMYLEANAWRVSFVNCSFLKGNTKNILFGNGANQGESIKFDHCIIADGGDFEVVGTGNQIYMYSTSLLNTRLWVTGNSNTINMYGGNLENPGSALAYQFIRIGNLAANNGTNTVNLFGVPITINPTTWTDPLFYVLSNNSLNFVNTTWPDINNYNVAGATGYLQYVDGGGKVSASGSSYWPLSGGQKPIVSKQVNSLYNGDLETGNTNGLTVTAYGTPGSTAVASVTAKKDGTYGLLVTTVVGGGINVTQNFPIRPGELVKIFCWAKLATLGAAPAGYFQVSFVSAGGQTIATYGEEVTSTSWTQLGTGLTYYAPPGAASVALIINGQPGANVLYFDNVAINIV